MIESAGSSSPTVTLIVGLISFAGGIATTVLGFILPRRVAQKKLRAAYYAEVTNMLEEMINEFDNYRIPYEAGHAFRALIHVITPDSKQVLDPDYVLRRSMNDLYEEAWGNDRLIETYGEKIPREKIDNWIKMAKRLKGDLHPKVVEARYESAGEIKPKGTAH